MGGLSVVLAPELSPHDRESCVRRMLRAMSPLEEPLLRVLSVGDCTLGALARPGAGPNEDTPNLSSVLGGRLHTCVSGRLHTGPDLLTDLAALGNPLPESDPAGLFGEAFGAWGEACLRRYHGAFALALWQPDEQRLLLARDPLGQRQCFYAAKDRVVVAASELRAVCASGLVSTELSSEAVTDTLVHGSPVAPHTIYRDIHALRPGEWFMQRGRAREVKTYWSFRDFSTVDLRGALPAGKFLEEFRLRLQGSLRRAAGSESSLGCILGNDTTSCLLAAGASRLTATALRTFSLCYADEAVVSQDLGPTIARHFGARHETVLLDGNQVAADLDRILAAYDQPGDQAISTFYLSAQAAGAGVSTLLSPLGAKPLLGLHPWFRPPNAFQREALHPWGQLMEVLGRLWRRSGQPEKNLSELKRSGGSLHELAALQRRWISESLREELLLAPGSFTPHEEFMALVREVPLEQPELVAGAWDLRTRIAAVEAPDQHRAAAAHGVSLACPFLDRDVVDWCRMHPGTAREALVPSGELPHIFADSLLLDTQLHPIADAEPPQAVWWQGPLRAFGEHVFSESSISHSGFFRTEAVRSLWQRARQEPSTDWTLLWRLALLIQFINRRSRHF